MNKADIAVCLVLFLVCVGGALEWPLPRATGPARWENEGRLTAVRRQVKRGRAVRRFPVQ